MEKTYVIKVLAKKDAKLNYKQAMTLTQEALAKETGAVDPKIFYVLNDIAQHKKFLKAFILLLYEQQKIGFERYYDMIPNNNELKDVISFKALYKGVMNVFVKIDDEVQTYGENIIAITDYANLLLTIISEIIKTNYIRTTFYDKHIDNPNVKSFLSHLLGGAALGIARWFGYRLENQDDGHELLQKLYVMNISKIKGLDHDNINDVLFLIEDLLNYIESNSYFIEEFKETEE